MNKENKPPYKYLSKNIRTLGGLVKCISSEELAAEGLVKLSQQNSIQKSDTTFSLSK